MSRTTSKPTRKSKKSFTLSQESVAFLEELRKKRRAASTSAVLDDIVRTFQRNQRKQALDKEITDFYDTLPAAALEEDAAWSKFALNELAKSRD